MLEATTTLISDALAPLCISHVEYHLPPDLPSQVEDRRSCVQMQACHTLTALSSALGLRFQVGPPISRSVSISFTIGMCWCRSVCLLLPWRRAGHVRAPNPLPEIMPSTQRNPYPSFDLLLRLRTMLHTSCQRSSRSCLSLCWWVLGGLVEGRVY